VKIVIAGGFGVGKTPMVRPVSELIVLVSHVYALSSALGATS
jgi:signal recognition particle receptor subunit beta